MPDDNALEGAISAALQRRGAGKSICPSDVARAVAADWRPLMPAIRRVAQAMAERGDLAVTQRGRPVRADIARGPIRLSLPEPQDPD